MSVFVCKGHFWWRQIWCLLHVTMLQPCSLPFPSLSFSFSAFLFLSFTFSFHSFSYPLPFHPLETISYASGDRRRQPWGTFSLDFCLIFLVTSEPHKLGHCTPCGCPPIGLKNILPYSFVTVYCVNFITILCVTLKLFSLSFVLLLTPNLGDDTVWRVL